MSDNQSSTPSHEPGTRKGEEIDAADNSEAGRHDTGSTETNRPTGTRTARDATAINPTEPLDPASPNMPPA